MVSRWPGDPTDGAGALDDPALTDLAAALDELSAYAPTALIGDELLGMPLPRLGEGPPEPGSMRGSTLPSPFRGIGVALLEAEDGHRVALIHLHRLPELAESNAEVVAEVLTEGVVLHREVPWSDLVTDVEVEQHERVVVTTFRMVEEVPATAILQELYNSTVIPWDG